MNDDIGFDAFEQIQTAVPLQEATVGSDRFSTRRDRDGDLWIFHSTEHGGSGAFQVEGFVDVVPAKSRRILCGNVPEGAVKVTVITGQDRSLTAIPRGRSWILPVPIGRSYNVEFLGTDGRRLASRLLRLPPPPTARAIFAAWFAGHSPRLPRGRSRYSRKDSTTEVRSA